jgi:hypothetical protein
LRARIQRPTIQAEAVILKADPPEALYQLRLAMYDTIATVLGPAKFSEQRPERGQFTPHVSAAYVNSDEPAQPIADALNKADPQPVTATFDTASLLVFHRDHRMYEWTQAHAAADRSSNVKAGRPATLTAISQCSQPFSEITDGCH